jgi:hypothetical protein
MAITLGLWCISVEGRHLARECVGTGGGQPSEVRKKGGMRARDLLFFPPTHLLLESARACAGAQATASRACTIVLEGTPIPLFSPRLSSAPYLESGLASRRQGDNQKMIPIVDRGKGRLGRRWDIYIRTHTHIYIGE